MPTINIDKSATGTTLQLAVGDRVQITLPESRTAGFRWQAAPASSPVYAVADEGFQAAPGIGGTGTHRWTLTARSKGSDTFEISYGRSWGTSSSAEPFRVTISVK